MQRVKWGSVMFNVPIKSASCTRYTDDTVLPPPFFFLFSFIWRSRLSGMVMPEEFHKLARASLKNIDNGVIDRILILFQPSSYIVADSTSIVNDGKVGIGISGRLGLGHVCTFSQMLGLNLIFKSFVCGLGEVRFFFKNGPDTHRFLKHDDASNQVHSKILHGNIEAFILIQLLFNNKHVIVEKLLKLLVYEIDGYLFKSIVVEHLKSSNVQYSAKVGFLHGFIN